MSALEQQAAPAPHETFNFQPHTCASSRDTSCVACTIPWFARRQHFFGTTPPEPFTVDEFGTMGMDTCGIWASIENLLRNILLIAQSGWGKTTIMFRALCFLLFRTDTPMVIFDGSGNGTLSKNLLLWWHQVLDHAEAQFIAQGKSLRPDLRARLLYMKAEERNRCGVAFDLFHPSVVRTTDGRDARLGVKEIVTALMGTLAYMEEENEKFKLVRRYGEAAFAVLAAAGGKAQDLVELYDIDSGAFRLRLRAEIERRYGIDLAARDAADDDSAHPEWTCDEIEERDYIRTQWRVIDDLFRHVKNSGTQLEHLTGSTLRHFSWLTGTFKWYFNRPIVRLDRFFTRGGVLLVHAASGDRDANANARAAIYAACRAAMRSKDRVQPCLFVLDEQEGWRMGLLADDVAANARNSAMYHWFSLHDPEQVGRAFKTLWNLCQRKIIGAVADEDVARFALLYTDLLRPDGLMVATERDTLIATHDVASEMTDARGRVATAARQQRHEEGGVEDYLEERVNAGLYAWNPHRADPVQYDTLCREIRTLEREHASLRQTVLAGRPDLQPALEALATRLRDLRWTRRFHQDAAEWGDQADTKTRVIRARPERDTDLEVDETKHESMQHARRTERTVSQQVRVQSAERAPIGEQIPFFMRDLVNPPIGRGLHIAMGDDTTFVDHPFDALPLDQPGADLRLEQLVRAQRERLEASWRRRRPVRRVEAAFRRADIAAHDVCAQPPAPTATHRAPKKHNQPRGPAPAWANRRGGSR